MKKLKYVKQLDPCGCTIACLAMIVDKEYFELRHFLNNNKEKLSPFLRGNPVHQEHFYANKLSSRIGFFPEEIISILEIFFNKRSKFIEFRGLENLKNHCILSISDMDGSKLPNSHAIVYDAKQKLVLNPCPDDNIKLDNKLTGYNVLVCIEILGEK